MAVLLERLQLRPELRNDMRALRIKRRGPRAFFETSKDGVHSFNGHLLVFEQNLEESGEHLSRRCTVCVYHVGEVMRLFEQFFKLSPD